MIRDFESLLAAAQQINGKKVVVVFPNNEETLASVALACEKKLAEFILVGDQQIIREKFDMGGDLPDGASIVHQTDITGALKAAVELIKGGTVDIVMKGGVDTSTFMKALLHEDTGLRTGRLLSDVLITEYPKRQDNQLLMITDGGLNLTPDLKDKIEILKNAVEIAHALGNKLPKVAILSSSELVNPKLESMVDAAIISKMNDRGQIKGCVIDGPLALDNAISVDAAQEKGIVSPVAGLADILILPTIDAANIFAKSASYFGGYRLAHCIAGSRIPILIPSRADKCDAKLLSIALGVIISAAKSK